MSLAFDARSLERRYAFLDQCPPALLPQIITLPVGQMPERVAGICAWQQALLEGRVPRAPWPEGRVGQSIALALEQLGLARFCKQQPELVDRVLEDIIAAVSRQGQVVEAEALECLRELEALERARRQELRKAKGRKPSGRRRTIKLDEPTRARLMEQARAQVRGRPAKAEGGLVAAWQERVRLWSQIAEVFGDLGQLLGRGWDLSLGVLQHAGWLEVMQLRALIERLPALREVVRRLGRLQETDEGEPVSERIFAPVRRLEEERRQVATPGVPGETRGIERGAELTRMLPVEAAMLGHCALRMLWHARRAERSLLLYHIEGVSSETVLREVEGHEAIEGTRPRPERGPIIAVIDTSGSMHGPPETIAKALVLQAMRVALEEKRRCFVYAYSGPGQVLEHELELSAGGLGPFLGFLGMSFHGGSDASEVLLRVVERLQADGWKRADVLLVSDGEWPVPHEALEGIAAARKAGTRLTGVQVGNLGRTGLHAVCDPVHVLREWAE